MRRLLPALALAIAFAAQAPAQASPASQWRSFTETQKGDFLEGLAVGMRSAASSAPVGSQAREEMLAHYDYLSTHVADVEVALDRYYDELRHADVPPWEAVNYCLAEAAPAPRTVIV